MDHSFCYSHYYCKQNLPAGSSSSSLYLGRPNQPQILTFLYSLINFPMQTKIIISHLKTPIPPFNNKDRFRVKFKSVDKKVLIVSNKVEEQSWIGGSVRSSRSSVSSLIPTETITPKQKKKTGELIKN